MYRLLTCPETAHLELIEYLDEPVGIIVTSCSRFRPPCDLGCQRTCAARLDRGRRCNEPTERLFLNDDTVCDDTSVEVGRHVARL